jgi:hypothetical protein
MTEPTRRRQWAEIRLAILSAIQRIAPDPQHEVVLRQMRERAEALESEEA